MCYAKLILLCWLGLAYSRPQENQSAKANTQSNVEVQKQIVFEVTPSPQTIPNNRSSQKKLEADTMSILAKIAEVNRRQGLVQKKSKPNYFHFPFSYARSNEDFQFPKDPFTNPILEYLKKEQRPGISVSRYRRPNGVSISMTKNDDDDDDVPEQYVKRKITHYQSAYVPNPYFNPPNMYGPQPYMNPYYQQYPNMLPYPAQQPGNFYHDSAPDQQMIKNSPNFPPNRARQNWNWPGANLFPIYVRDPFLQMYYAVTNMIEYGPSAGSDGPCKLTPRPQGSRIKPKTTALEKSHQVSLEMNQKDGTEEIQIFDVDGEDLTDNAGYLDVEDIDVGGEDLVRFKINLPTAASLESRELKKNEKHPWNEFKNQSKQSILSQLVAGLSDPPNTRQATPEPVPIQNQILQVDELEDEAFPSEKSPDISVSNEGSRKVFSKDNTGNGIFIQKLKVRQGGVAIAGPGGIATAGSGGTAIVGPNGVAYTHPDGLAIAGSGTQVVAVDPKIDLNDVIKNSVLNGTRHVPNTRVGKVVAVGPVVYYNRG